MSLRAPSKAPDSPERVWVKLFRLLLICGALGLVVLAVGFFYVTRDVPALDDSSLRVPTTTVPDSQNGLIRLEKIDGKALKFEEYALNQGAHIEHVEELLNLHAHDDALVTGYLAQAQPELDEILACFAQPYFEYPGLENPTQEILKPAQYEALLLAEEAVVLRGQLAYTHRDFAQTVAAITELRHMSSCMIEGYPIEIEILYAARANERAGGLALELINEASLSKDILAQLTVLYAQPLPWLVATQNALRQKYEEFVWGFELTRQTLNASNALSKTGEIPFYSPLRKRYVFTDNYTRNQAITFYTRTISDLNGPYSGVNRSALAMAEQFPFTFGKHVWLETIRPNALGHVLLSLYVTSPAIFIKTAYQQTADDRLMQIGIELRRYYDKQHDLPRKLTDLIPDYLIALPTDPFDNKPLRYNPVKGLVYSIGDTVTDNGGGQPITIALIFQNVAKQSATAAASLTN